MYVSVQACIHACISLPSPSILLFLPCHFMISFTARLSRELFTYIYMCVPLPHFTFFPEPQSGGCPLTTRPLITKFNTVLHVVTSLSLSYLAFQQHSTHKDHLPCLKYLSLLLATVNSTFSQFHPLPAISQSFHLALKSWCASGLQPGFLCLSFCLSVIGSCPVVLMPYVHSQHCLSWLCLWISHSNTPLARQRIEEK